MSSLVERLSAPDIGIDGASAHQVRACLAGLAVAIQGEANGADQAALQRSLQNWWDWFEDEGYERNALATALRRLVSARIGEAGFQELLSFSQSIASDPEGLPILISHLQEAHPALAEELAELEAQALEDESQLMAVAGGTKLGKDAVYAGLGLGLGAGVFYLRHQYKKIKELEATGRLEAIKEHAAIDARLDERVLQERLEHRLEPDFMRLGTRLRAMSPEERSAWFKESRSIQGKGKLLHQYEAADIEKHCDSLMWDHFITHEERFALHVDNKITNNSAYIEKAKTAIRETDDYKEYLQEYIDDDFRVGHIPTKEANYAQELEDSPWFKEMLAFNINAAKDNEFKAIRRELLNSYKVNMGLNVATEKQRLANVADDEMEKYLQENLRRLSPDRFGVRTEIHAATRKVEGSIEQEAETLITDAEAAGRGAERDL